MERGERENRGKGAGNKKHGWWVQNRQGGVGNSMGSGKTEELICMTPGHELRSGELLEGVEGCRAEWGKGEKMGQL